MKTEVKKIPSLICKKCGSFRVIMTDEGPECNECASSAQLRDDVDLSMEVEYLIYQLNSKEIQE